MIEALAAGGLSLVGGWIGAYLGSYLKKKGENLATHEDIGMLLDQVRAVTQTTKEIEAKISGDVWNQQKRWEMKREVIFDAMKRVVQADNMLLSFSVILKVEHTEDAAWAETVRERQVKWLDAANALDESRILVAVVCSEETKKALDDYGLLTSKIAAGITHKDAQAYPSSSKALAQALLSVRATLRKELGIETVATVSAGGVSK